ncbi:MAG: hypothetical protein CMP10_12845 [Zetaproteobacteria bacterium]|nr:hypothetical protein [Pseudobdellovibrionaceae bacterium]
MINVNKAEFIPYHNALVMEESTDSIISFDFEFKITAWNPVAKECFGYDFTEVKGKNILDVLSVEDQISQDREFFAMLIRGNKGRQENTLRKNHEGRWSPYITIGFPLFCSKGKVIGGTLIFRDCSEETYLAQLLERMEDVGKIVGWQYVVSDQSVDFTEGATAIIDSEIKGWHSMWDFSQFLSAKFRANFDDMINHSLKTGKSRSIDVTSKNDEKRWFRISWKTESVANTVVRIYGIVRDISEEKNTEKTIAKQELELVSRGRLAAVGQLAAGVAHEINNPLAIVVVNMRILLGRAKNDNLKSKDVHRILPMMQDGVKRVSRIVAGLLDFSKKQGGVKMSPVDMNQLIQDTICICKANFDKNRIIVDTTSLQPNVTVLGKAIDVKHVLLSLIKNAEEFLVKEKINEPQIMLSSSVDHHGKVRILVTNNGPKISKDIVDKVFQPFFTTKDIGEGTGLGMSASYGMMVEHNGRLYVDKDKEMTTFVMEFPPIIEDVETAVA